MKDPAPERQNVRIIHLFTSAISLPFMGMRAVYRWSCTLCEKLKSPERRHAEDQRRQSQVRRGLRGLGADHVQEPAKPA